VRNTRAAYIKIMVSGNSTLFLLIGGKPGVSAKETKRGETSPNSHGTLESAGECSRGVSLKGQESIDRTGDSNKIVSARQSVTTLQGA